jgi:hypothetical protein
MGADDNSKTKLPYEPPRIFDLFSSPAYAQQSADVKRTCGTGGSPGGECRSGGAAAGGNCLNGGTPSDQCKTGQSAAAPKCFTGAFATNACQQGYLPLFAPCKAGILPINL